MVNPAAYVMGNSFPNIYGGRTASHFGDVTFVKWMSKQGMRRYPGRIGMYSVSNGQGYVVDFDTFEEVQEYVKEVWPEGVITFYHKEFAPYFKGAVLGDLGK